MRGAVRAPRAFRAGATVAERQDGAAGAPPPPGAHVEPARGSQLREQVHQRVGLGGVADDEDHERDGALRQRTDGRVATARCARCSAPGPRYPCAGWVRGFRPGSSGLPGTRVVTSTVLTAQSNATGGTTSNSR